MTIHYHGADFGPRTELLRLSGKHFCVSYGSTSPKLVETVHAIGQSVMIDNGAYSFWRKGENKTSWHDYYAWVEPWLRYRTTWAVIPDVIDGTERQNDDLLHDWPFSVSGAPVWHFHESFNRLNRIAEIWPRVCIGSSGEYAQIGTEKWHYRMREIMNVLCPLGYPRTWIHLLRGMAMVGNGYPLSSVDSFTVARHSTERDIVKTANAFDAIQAPARWEKWVDTQCKMLI